jgi:alpha-1,3-rhamnosyl/mannosyltransferase
VRIGLDFRFLSVGKQHVVRGIPRFTQEQLQSVLAIDHDTTYLLLCDPGDDIGAIRPEIRAASNAHIVCAPDPAPPAFGPTDDTGRLLARYSGYQRWIESLNLDLYHATCHFWVSRLIMPGFDVCPYVVTAYDLQPLLYPVPVQREPMEAYHRGLLFLEQATRVAAISQATADAIAEHIGVPVDRIDLTRPAISPCFRPIPPTVTRSILDSLDHPARQASRRRVRIPPEYVVCVTDLHFTKNLVTLLAAYAGLPAATRSRFPLVIAGQLGTDGAHAVRRYATSLDCEGDVIITGRVSDHELLALYNGATLMVHPSHYEGFGLTVAEAMRCGTPVITTTRSALPEVAGDAALLVDSEDAAAFTNAIEQLVHDRALRDDLRRRGRVQAARFSARALGQATLDCYRSAISTARSAIASPIRLALWSPVTPQPSGLSEYMNDLVSALSAEPGLQLDVFVDDGVMPPLGLLRMARVHHWSDFDRCARHAPYDVTIYEVGRPPFERYMRPALLENPGIVVLHDPAASDVDALVTVARCCVVPTDEAAAGLRRRHPKVDVRVIPVGVRDPWPDGFHLDRVIARASLALEPEAFVSVVLGPVNREKHVEMVLEAIAHLRRAGANALLAIVGWLPDPAYASLLRARAKTLGVGDAVRVTGAVSRTVVDAYLAASDVTVVLRDANTHQVPSAVVRACAAGRCLVMSDIAAAAVIPDSACVRVAATTPKRDEIAAALSSLFHDPGRREDLQRGARAHFQSTARLETVVEGYVRLIRERAELAAPTPNAASSATRIVRHARPRPRSGPIAYSKVCELEDFAHPQLRDAILEVCPHKRAVFGSDYPRGHEHREDWEAAMAVRALADGGALRSDARVLGVAAGIPGTFYYLTRRVGEVVAIDTDLLTAGERSRTEANAPFEFRADRMTVQPMYARHLTYPDGSFDAVVCRLHARDIGDVRDVARVVHELGRVVKPGGVLSISADVLVASDPGSAPLPPRAALLSSKDVQQFIARSSGLDPIDELRPSVSHWTLSTARDIVSWTADWQSRLHGQPDGSELAEWAVWDLPLIVLSECGRRYTSVHLALRRAPARSLSDNC